MVILAARACGFLAGGWPFGRLQCPSSFHKLIRTHAITARILHSRRSVYGICLRIKIITGLS